MYYFRTLRCNCFKGILVTNASISFKLNRTSSWLKVWPPKSGLLASNSPSKPLTYVIICKLLNLSLISQMENRDVKSIYLPKTVVRLNERLLVKLSTKYHNNCSIHVSYYQICILNMHLGWSLSEFVVREILCRGRFSLPLTSLTKVLTQFLSVFL